MRVVQEAVAAAERDVLPAAGDLSVVPAAEGDAQDQARAIACSRGLQLLASKLRGHARRGC